MNQLTVAQVKQLLAPIRPVRVLQDPRNNSHVSQQDVTAHLTRIFGFGNFDTQIVSLDLVFEAERANKETGVLTGRWDCCYRCRFRLTIKNPDGTVLATYEDASCGDAQNQNRQDAHDLAMKSAISVAKKRCTINLGDQFGLSLYNKGQMEALVRGTLVLPDGWQDEVAKADVQEGIQQQVSMGTDETEKPADPDEAQVAAIAASLGATVVTEEKPTDTEQAVARARKAAVK